jgi:hypothetical protein
MDKSHQVNKLTFNSSTKCRDPEEKFSDKKCTKEKARQSGRLSLF